MKALLDIEMIRSRYDRDRVLLQPINLNIDLLLQTVKRNQQQYKIPLKIVSYEELYGWTMDAIVKEIGRKNNCKCDTTVY